MSDEFYAALVAALSAIVALLRVWLAERASRSRDAALSQQVEAVRVRADVLHDAAVAGRCDAEDVRAIRQALAEMRAAPGGGPPDPRRGE